MKLKNILLVSTAAFAFAGMTIPAFAGGTAANSSITNTINISYDSDGTPIDLDGAASDTFKVDEKIAFSLAPNDTPTSVTVNPKEQNVELVFLLTNDGNAARDFDINVAQSDNGAPIGLTLDPTGAGAEGTYSVYTSPNAGAGPYTLYNPNGVAGVGSLVADQDLYVIIRAYVPADAAQDAEDIFDVTAQPLNAASTAVQAESTVFDASTQEAVYGDTGADGTETAQERFVVSSALVSATKTVAIVSENRDGNFVCGTGTAEGGSAYIPGACVAYTITLTNDAAANENATSFSFSDTFSGGFTFVTVEPGNTFDSVNVGAGGISATVNSLAPGSSATLTFRALID